MTRHIALYFSRVFIITLALSLDTRALADDPVRARVLSVNPDTHATILRGEDITKKWSLSGADVQKFAGQYLEEGDIVAVAGAPPTATDVSIVTKSVSCWPRVIAIGISGIVLCLAAVFSSGFQPQKFLVGADNRVSNSKCQVVLWFGTALTAYLATLSLRLIESDEQLIGGIAIPANVLAMTGLSGLTYAGAKMIAVTKNNGDLPAVTKNNGDLPAVTKNNGDLPAVTKNNGDLPAVTKNNGDLPSEAPASKTAPTNPGKEKPTNPGKEKQSAVKTNWLTDLFCNDQNELDFGDFQMILIVMISVTIYIVSTYLALGTLPMQEHVALPDVDGSLLAAFGIGQGSYLAKKAALPVGTG